MYTKIILFFQKISMPLARISLFIIYFWFGVLKVLGTSPANPLVESLLKKTLPIITFGQFIVLFGLFEMLIGILFLIPKMTKIAILLFTLHMITTFLPLLFLPQISWQAFFVPTLEGQYVIKNFVLIALVVGIAAKLNIKKLEN